MFPDLAVTEASAGMPVLFLDLKFPEDVAGKPCVVSGLSSCRRHRRKGAIALLSPEGSAAREGRARGGSPVRRYENAVWDHQLRSRLGLSLASQQKNTRLPFALR